jgi:hypothetical protein
MPSDILPRNAIGFLRFAKTSQQLSRAQTDPAALSGLAIHKIWSKLNTFKRGVGLWLKSDEMAHSS